MKNELINKITNTMKDIVIKTKEEALYSNKEDYTIKYDIKNEFIFVSLSMEDLTNANYTTYCDPNLFEDVSMYDLECLDDYDIGNLEMIYTLLNSFCDNKNER